jgi:hypothetical protein
MMQTFVLRGVHSTSRRPRVYTAGEIFPGASQMG